MEEKILCYEDCIKINGKQHSFDPIQILLFDKWVIEGVPLNWKVSAVSRVVDKKSKNYGNLLKRNPAYFSSLPQAIAFLQNRMLIGTPKTVENGVRKKRGVDGKVPEQSPDEAMYLLKKLDARITETTNVLLKATEKIIENEAALSLIFEKTGVLSENEYKNLLQKFLRKQEKSGIAKVFVEKQKRKRNHKPANEKRKVGTAVLKHKKRRRSLA